MKRIVLFLLFGFWIFDFGFNTQLNAQLSPLATGLQKYRQGDLEGAITDFETAYSQDKENEKIKTYLFNCYLALGVRYAEEQNYPKAIDYFDRAQKLNPADQEVKDLYQSVKTKVVPSAPAKPAVTTQPPAAVPQAPAVVPQLPAVSPPTPTVEMKEPVLVPQPPAKVVPKVGKPVEKKPVAEKIIETKPKKITKPQTTKVVSPVEEKKEEVRRKIVREESRKDILQDELEEKLKLMLTRIEREREDLLKQLASWEEKERKERQHILRESQKFMQRTTIIIGLGLLFLTFFILGPIYSNVKQTSKKRDEIFHGYEERIKIMIEEYKVSMVNLANLQAVPKTEKTVPIEPITSPETIIEGATPELRLRAIEIIEKELNFENKTEKIVALRLLEPFLNDTDKKVQLQAAGTLSKYAPAKTANFIRSLVSKKGKEFTPEMILSLSSLPPIGQVETLLSFLNHPDLRVREEIILSLHRLLKTKKDELPPAIKERIEEIIAEIFPRRKMEI